MSWYVLHCRAGQEQAVIHSCRQHLSVSALEDVFVFQCERLWKKKGLWSRFNKEMFPGYVFLQSSRQELLTRELDQYLPFLTVMEEKGALISVYDEEEENLRALCGETHCLRMSYGYKDREAGISYITAGPLKDRRDRVAGINWHKRYAQLELTLARQKAVIFAGIDLAEDLENQNSRLAGSLVS